MASVKLKFLKEKQLKDGTHPVAIQVIHNRKKKLFYIGHSFKIIEWDNDNNQPNTKNPNYRLYRSRIKSAITDLNAIILRLENIGEPFSVLDIEAEFKPDRNSRSESVSFNSFADDIIDSLKEENRLGNAKAYENAKAIFNKLMGDDWLIKDVSIDVINNFIHKMTLHGLTTNSRGVHLRALRAIINKAIKADIYEEQNYPFKKISIKTQKTRKRAVNKDVLKLVSELDVSKENNLQLYKDLFLFSFYNRGMNFVDMAYLKVSNIKNGRIEYARQKTGQHFSIKITDQAREIIQKYNDLTTAESYIFPIIYRKGKEYLDYKNAMRLMNKKLKKISELLKLDVPLTTYVSRHSWATIAKRSGISTAVISEGLGHESEETTQVYLDSFENDVLDDANELIIG